MSRLWQMSQLALGVACALCASSGCAHHGSEPDQTAQENPSAMPSDGAGGVAADGTSASFGSGSMSASSSGASNSDNQVVSATDGGMVGALGQSDDQSRIASMSRPPEATPDTPGAIDRSGTAEGEKTIPANAPLATPEATLLRMSAFDRGEIPIVQLAKQSGGKKVVAYSAKMLKNRRAAEKQIAHVAKGLGVSLDAQTDDLAMKEMEDDQTVLQQLKQLSGAEFDRKFALHMQEDRQHAVDTVTSLRAQSTEPKIIALIDKVLPAMQREADDAQTLPVGVPSAANP